MKKILIPLLLIAMLLLAGNALAEGEIRTREDLEALADPANNRGSYVLKSNIDLSGAPWTPIPYFEGTLDGGGYKITGLRLEGSYSDTNIGLFATMTGTVSNLTLENMSVNIQAEGSYCQVYPFGFFSDLWNASPYESAPHVINCTVKGEVTITGSENCFIGCAPLAGAQNSHAQVDIALTGSRFTQNVVRDCVQCQAEGELEVTLTGKPDGVMALILDSLDSTANYTVSVDQNGQELGNLAVNGIQSFNAASMNNTVRGSIAHEGITCAVWGGDEGAEDCESYLRITSDQISGLYNCRYSKLYGELKTPGLHEEAFCRFVQDEKEQEECGNRCDATWEYLKRGDTPPQKLGLHASLGRYSVLNTEIGAENLTKTNVELGFFNVAQPLEDGKKPEQFRNGAIRLTTTEGDMNIYSELSTAANTTLETGSGIAVATAASYNSGTVTGRSDTGDMRLGGGLIYNSGDVTVYTNTTGWSYALGVYGENGYNTGKISIHSNGTGEAQATGANGGNTRTGGWNKGEVIGELHGDGHLNVCGVYGNGGVNEGPVSATGYDVSAANRRSSQTGEYSKGCNVIATGVYGTSGWNGASVSAVSNGPSHAGAIGCTGGDNEGSVSSRSSGGNAVAKGIERNGHNSGDVVATAEGQVSQAYGAQNSGTNSGAIKAYCHGSGPNAKAYVYAQGGTGFAEGYNAYAKGASVTAHSTGVGKSISDGRLWGLISHNHPSDYGCNAPAYAVTSNSESPNDGLHTYNLYAEAEVENPGGGSGSGRPDDPGTGMAEDEEGDDSSAKVTIMFTKESEKESVQIKRFTYAKGSFGFDDDTDTDYREILLNIFIENTGEDTGKWNFDIELPEGFSFSPNYTLRTVSRAVSVKSGEMEPVKVKVYPIYTENYSNTMIVRLRGDIRRMKGYPVVKVNEGRIYCRPTGYVNKKSYSPIIVNLDYDPVRDLADSSTTNYNQRLAMLTCALSQAVYNANGKEKNFKRFSEDDYITNSLLNLGFQCIEWHPNYGTTGVASAIAQKKVILDDGTVRTVMLVVVRGTVAYEWIGNFFTGYTDGASYHNDFYSCAVDVTKLVRDYITKYNIDAAAARTVLTGHSRAAAVVDLMAHSMNGTDTWGANNLVAYTYATPSSTTSPEADSNIFNITYAYDVIGFVPYGNFGKYGKNYYIGMVNRDAPAAVKNAYYDYTNGVFFDSEPTGFPQWWGNYAGIEVMAALSPSLLHFLDGPSILTAWDGTNTNYFQLLGFRIGKYLAEHPGDTGVARAHGAENYLAWVFNAGVSYCMSIQEILEDVIDKNNDLLDNIETIISAIPNPVAKGAGKLLKSAMVLRQGCKPMLARSLQANAADGGSYVFGCMCPVNVEIFDDSWNLLGSFENHQIAAAAENAFMFNDEDADFMVLSLGQSYNIRITATADGEMDTLIAKFVSSDNGLTLPDGAGFESIPVHAGEVFELRIDADGQLTESTLTSSLGSVYYPGTYETSGISAMVPGGEISQLAPNAEIEVNQAVIPYDSEIPGLYSEGWTYAFLIDNGLTWEGDASWEFEVLQDAGAEYRMTFAADGKRFMNLRSDGARPQSPCDARVQVTASWGDQTATAYLTIHYVETDLPTGVDLPPVLNLQVGKTTELQLSFDGGYQFEGRTWFTGAVEGDYTGFDAAFVCESDGSTLRLTPKAGASGIYPTGSLTMVDGNVALVRPVVFRVADENGFVPGDLVPSFDSEDSVFMNIAILPEFQAENVPYADSWMDDFWLTNADALYALYGDVREWTVTLESGPDLQAYMEDEFDHGRLIIDRPPKAPGATVYRVTCTWGALSASKLITLNAVTPKSLPDGVILRGPDGGEMGAVWMNVGDTYDFTSEFDPLGWTMEGRDDRQGFDMWLEEGAEDGLALNFDWYSGSLEALQPGVYQVGSNTRSGNVLVYRRITVCVPDENGYLPGAVPTFDYEGDAAEYSFMIGAVGDGEAEGWLTVPYLFDATVNNVPALQAFYGEAEAVTWSYEYVEGFNAHLALYPWSDGEGFHCGVYVLETPEAPDAMRFDLVCEYNGYAGSLPVRIWFVAKPDRLPTDSAFPDRLTLPVGETIPLMGFYPENDLDVMDEYVLLDIDPEDIVDIRRIDSFLFEFTGLKPGSVSGMTAVVAHANGAYHKRMTINVTDKALRLPAGLTTIAEEAFAGLDDIVVVIPGGVETIGDDAFEHHVTVICEAGSYASQRCQLMGLYVIEK